MPEASITKRALAEALKSLAEEQPLSKITVGIICKRCGMSRKGFYYHFKDKYDLINWVFYSEFILPLEEKNYFSVWNFFNDMCAYFFDNRDFYTAAFALEGENSFSSFFSGILEHIAIDYLEQSFEEERSFYAKFYADAFRVSIIRWLCGGASIPPQEYCQLLKKATMGIAQHGDGIELKTPEELVNNYDDCSKKHY